ncbi:hypothetical protein SDC9_07719 [bioreactor metagenome]|uniref:Mannosyl-glycoprotein endo-beta-N-acetylglucosamidase-like domain-containing protein n=1 Tax=bioreactor metagenome TaxID=1076179 RepID=A0A644T5S0_9ZZZZ
MAFIPLLAMSALELNTVPSVIVGDNNTANTTEEVVTNGFQLTDVEKDRLEKALKINTYFHERSMPLFGHGMQFVLVAEKYGLPYDLLPAIAVRESSGGKNYINNNPFGWGSAKIPFSDFNEAIEVVGKNLAGANPRTARYYATPDVKKKLYYYNGTVIKGYEDQVIAIMNKIDKTSIDIDVELASK